MQDSTKQEIQLFLYFVVGLGSVIMSGVALFWLGGKIDMTLDRFIFGLIMVFSLLTISYILGNSFAFIVKKIKKK